MGGSAQRGTARRRTHSHAAAGTERLHPIAAHRSCPAVTAGEQSSLTSSSPRGEPPASHSWRLRFCFKGSGSLRAAPALTSCCRPHPAPARPLHPSLRLRAPPDERAEHRKRSLPPFRPPGTRHPAKHARAHVCAQALRAGAAASTDPCALGSGVALQRIPPCPRCRPSPCSLPVSFPPQRRASRLAATAVPEARRLAAARSRN